MVIYGSLLFITMADRSETLLNAINPSATGVAYGTPIATSGRTNFMVALRMSSTTGSAVNDLMDFWIEASPEQAFTNAYKIAIVPFYNPLTGTAAQSTIFTQVTGNVTLPAATTDTTGATTTATTTLLRQTYQITVNPNLWVRAGYRVQGTVGSFTNVSLYLLSNTVP